MNNKKLLSYLSLAQKAGKIVSGEFMVENSIKDGTAEIVIIASDASENTTKKITDMCNYRNVIYIKCLDVEKEMLGRAIGKEFRVCAAITDKGFANAIKGIADMEVI